MAKIIPLSEAVGDLIGDGSAVAMEGFTHLIPHAAGHEIIRQGKRDLILYRMTPDVIYDQLIGAGAVAAHRPDVTVIHAQRADRDGNVQLWGIVGIQKEAALAANNLIVTVEEIVDRFDAVPGEMVLPHHVVTAICHAPGGAHPSYAQGYTQRDNGFYTAWDAISRDRNRFEEWITHHVRGTTSIAELLDSIANAGDGE